MMKAIRNLYKNEEGATSVLVIFMMILLVTLGTFAITSALVNFRFAQHTASWNVEYYQLESKAEAYMQGIDSQLFDAQVKAVAFIESEFGPGGDVETVSNALNAAYEGFAMQTVGFSGTQTFDSDTNPDAHFTVSYNVNNLLVDAVNYTAGELSITLNSEAPRYTLSEWRQWQTPVELNTTQDLWPGLIDDTGTNPDVPEGEGLFDNPTE